MNKKLKIFLYVFTASIIIAFVNALLAYTEYLIIVLPQISNNSLIDAAGVIMLILNFVLTIFGYGYVGRKMAKMAGVKNKAFCILITLLPLILSLPGVMMFGHGIFNSSEWLLIMTPSLGMIILSAWNIGFIYFVAILPSIFMFMGYIIQYDKEKYKAKLEEPNGINN